MPMRKFARIFATLFESVVGVQLTVRSRITCSRETSSGHTHASAVKRFRKLYSRLTSRRKELL